MKNGHPIGALVQWTWTGKEEEKEKEKKRGADEEEEEERRESDCGVRCYNAEGNGHRASRVRLSQYEMPFVLPLVH